MIYKQYIMFLQYHGQYSDIGVDAYTLCEIVKYFNIDINFLKR